MFMLQQAFCVILPAHSQVWTEANLSQLRAAFRCRTPRGSFQFGSVSFIRMFDGVSAFKCAEGRWVLSISWVSAVDFTSASSTTIQYKFGTWAAIKAFGLISCSPDIKPPCFPWHIYKHKFTTTAFSGIHRSFEQQNRSKTTSSTSFQGAHDRDWHPSVTERALKRKRLTPLGNAPKQTFQLAA